MHKKLFVKSNYLFEDGMIDHSLKPLNGWKRNITSQSLFGNILDIMSFEIRIDKLDLLYLECTFDVVCFDAN